MYKRTGFQIEILILSAIVALNIADFFELLDPFWDYVKKLISWILVGYLFYQISPTKLLTGVQHKIGDVSYVIGAFFLNINDLLQYMHIARKDLLQSITSHVAFIEQSVNIPQIMVNNISEASWNSLSLFGIIPEAPAHILSVATNLTLSNSAISFGFTNGESVLTYIATPVGLNGAILQIYNTILPHAASLQQWGLLIGFSIMILLTLFIALRIPIQEKSVLGLLHEGGIAKGLSHLTWRVILTFWSVIFFFLFVFNLVMEWLAIAIDAPLLVIGIIASIAIMISKHTTFAFDKWVEWVSSIGADAIKPYTELLHRKKTFLLGIAGLLVLHVVTEIPNFILPFTIPLRDLLYLSQLGPGHENLFMIQNWTQTILDIPLTIVILLNITTWGSLMAIPAYMWYKMFHLHKGSKEEISFSPTFLGIFSAGLVVCIMEPLITMKQILIPGLIGVDFLTHTLTGSATQLTAIAIATFGVIYFLAHFSIKKFLYIIPILASITFMTVYVLYFFFSAVKYYLQALEGAINSQLYILATIFFLFLIQTAVFYILSLGFYYYEIIRE